MPQDSSTYGDPRGPEPQHPDPRRLPEQQRAPEQDAPYDQEADSDGLLEDLPPAVRASVIPRPPAPDPVEPRGVPPHTGRRPPTYAPTPTGSPSVSDGDVYGATLPDTELDGGSYGPLTVRGVSVRGDSHRHLHECRQDALGVVRIGSADSGLLLLAVADGVGTERLSHRGAHGMIRDLARELDPVAAQLTAALGASDAAAFAQLVDGVVKAAVERMVGQVDPAVPLRQYSTTLRALLVPLDPAVRVRGFLAVGDGGLFLLRRDGWRDLEAPDGAPVPSGTGVLDTRTAALPVSYERIDTRLLGPAEPDDVLVLCTDGFSAPLGGTQQLRELLAEHWGPGAPVPQPADFLWQAQTRIKSYDDDRTVICLWEGTADQEGTGVR